MKYFSNKVLDKKIKEEGGGGDYTAGEGIDISENEISIDSDTLDDIADGAEARGYFDANGILGTSRDPFWQIGETSGLVELKSAYSYVGAKKGIIFSVNQNEDVNAHLEVVYKTMAGASNPIPVLHSRLPFYSDSFVSAGGLSPGGGGGGGGATSLEGLDDVEYTGTPIAGQALVYVIRDGVGLWTNATPTGGGTVTTVANVPPTSGGDIPKAELSAALGIGTVTQGDSQLVTGGTVYSAINSALSSVLKFVGVTTTAISDGSTTNPVIINGSSYTAVTGNVVLYGAKEYLWTGSAWEELGDEASWALKTITITGTGYLTGGGSLEANRTIDIADAIKTKIEHGESAYNRTDWDQYLGIDANGHIYVKDNRGFYSSSFVSAGGVGSGSGGGGGGATELADLEDINFVTPITGGQVLMYRDLGGGDGEWYNAYIEVGGVKTVANVVPTSGGNIPLADLASAFTTGGYKLTDHEYTNGPGLSLSNGTFSLTQAVQTSLRKADTAIQTVYDLVIKNSAGTTQLTYKPATSGTYSITLTKAMVGLGDVENTKLSTWAGSGNITTVGMISGGTWQGTPVGYNYVAAHYIGGTRTASAAGQATLLGIDAISNAQSSGSSDLSRIVWDATNNAWHLLGNLYADGFVSAGGMSDSGGGGGASNLYDLLDMSSTISDKPSGTGQKIIVFNPNGTDKQNRSGAWEYANMPTGSVTSVAGVSPVNGDIPVASLQTAIGLGDYVSKSGDTMTGDLQLMNSSLRFLDDNGNIAGWLTWGGSDKQPKWYDTSGSTARWENIYHSGNFIAGTNYVSISGDESITGKKTFSLQKWSVSGNESNQIEDKGWGNSTYYKTDDSAVLGTNYSIRHALRFRWYGDYYDIGAIRDGSTGTIGFGIGKENSGNTHILDLFRVSTSGAWVIGNTVYHSGNLSLATLAGSTQVGSPAVPVYYTGSAFATVQATFGNASYGEHDANNIASNGLWYYNSNGPATSLGASTTDGALYSQAYSTSWVGQIAQDYRNGHLYVRGKNNGTWQSWLKVWDSGNFVAGTNYVAPQTTLAGYGITDWKVTPTSTALDSLTTSGVYRLGTQTTPHSNYGNLLVVRGGSTSDTLAQVYFPYNADAIFFRRGTTSNFTNNTWQHLYHSGNANKSNVAWACSILTARDYVLFRNTDDTANAGYVGRGSSSRNDIQLYAYAGGKLELGANNVTTITIDTNNNVGIGTASPGAKFQVYNGDSIFGNSSVASGRVKIVGVDSTASNFALTVVNSAGTAILYARNDGNVGIRTSMPGSTLDVAGNIGLTGALEFNRTSTGVIRNAGYWAAEMYGFSDRFQITAYNPTSGSGNSSVRFADSLVTVSGGLTVSGGINAQNGITIASGKILSFNGTYNVSYNYTLECSTSAGFRIRSNYTNTPGISLNHAGSLTVTNAIVSGGDQVISSDLSKKTHIEDLDLSVEQIAQMPAVSFEWKDGRGKSFGTIAQPVKPLFPQAVLGEEGNYTVAYAQGGWVFGVKNAREIVSLKSHETEQDKEIRKLKARVRDLEKQLKMRS